MSDLQELLLRLDDAGVAFVLVGGYAAMLHGSSLLTRDIDVCAELSPPAIEKLRCAFRDFHPVHRLSAPQRSFPELPEAGVALDNLHPGTDLGVLDLLGHASPASATMRVSRAMPSRSSCSAGACARSASTI